MPFIIVTWKRPLHYWPFFRRIQLTNSQHLVREWLSADQWVSKFNSLRPRQNGRLFADDTFKRIFLNENIRISTKNSLKFVPKGLINNIPALVLIMAWRRPGDKPLSEPMLVRPVTHICITRPQWVNGLLRWPGTTLLPESMMILIDDTKRHHQATTKFMTLSKFAQRFYVSQTDCKQRSLG